MVAIRLRVLTAFAVLGIAIASTSCAGLGDVLTKPSPEPPIQDDESYLAGGPNTEVEFGADQKTLLEEYAELKASQIQLETKLQEMQFENEAVQTRLRSTETERNNERSGRAMAEAELQRTQELVRDLQSKVLALEIANARLEQEALRMRISALQTELAGIRSNPAEATSQSPGSELAPRPGGGR